MIEHDCKEIVADFKWMMSLVGLWPDKESNKCLLFTKKAITFFFSFGIYASNAIEIYQRADMADNMYMMTPMTAYLTKLVLVVYHLETLSSIADDIGSEMFNFDFEPRERILKRTIKITNILSGVFRTWLGFFLVFFIAYPILDNQPLPMPVSFELGMFRIPMFVFQVIGMSIVAWVTNGVDLLLAALMSITSSQIDILKERLSSSLKSLDLEDDDGDVDNEGIRRFLSDCVEHHLFIARFAEKINKTFAVIILLQFLSATFSLCDGLFHVMSVETMSSQFMQVMMYLLIIMQQLSMYCWFGNDVMIKSLELLDACYQSEWYKFDLSNRKMILLIMENVKKPIVITAYKFSTASLPALLTILKWSYSALAVLRNMYAKK